MSYFPDGMEFQTNSKYVKLQPGENKLRLVGEPIFGLVYWTTNGDTRKPNRVRPGTKVEIGKLEINQLTGQLDMPKPFMASKCWDFSTNELKIVEFTQKDVLKGLQAFEKNPKWGAPTEYNIIVTRSGEKKSTKYSVMPEPKEPLDEMYQKIVDETFVRLEALYEGNDPFNPDIVPSPQPEMAKAAETKLDDIPF